MKRFQFLTSVLAGTFVYVIVSFFGGQDGLWATSQMQRQKIILSSHTAEIQKIHDKLFLEHTALEKDNDVIQAYARKLGYVSEGEKLVKITGLASNFTGAYEAGTVKKYVTPIYVPEWFCKIFGLVCGILLFCIMFLKSLLKAMHDKKVLKNSVKGIPIYDLPQM